MESLIKRNYLSALLIPLQKIWQFIFWKSFGPEMLEESNVVVKKVVLFETENCYAVAKKD